MQLRLPTVAALCAMVLAAPPALSQEFPTKQIRLIVGFAAGGSTDVLGRALAPEAGRRLGQEVIVINKPGAAGTLAVNDVIGSPPDGYTIGIAASASLTLVHMFQNIRGDLLEATESLVQVGRQRVGIATKADSPLRSFKDLVDFARANPGKVSIGIPGAGTSSELFVRAIAQHERLEINIVPFAGDAPSATAMLGGHVTAISASAGSWAVHVREGAMRMLVSLEKDRLDVAPEIPSLNEIGYPFAGSAIVHLFAPRGLPASVKKRLIDGFAAASQTPLYVDIATRNSLNTATAMSGEELDRHLREDRASLAELVTRLGIGKDAKK
jgi:tripartite-type tricarboxylate transporter receptor subunit TctC